MKELNLQIAYKQVGYLCAPEMWAPEKRIHTIHMLGDILVPDFLHVQQCLDS